MSYMDVNNQLYSGYILLTFFYSILFIILLSIFGLIFYYFLSKRKGRDWDLKSLEIFAISFGIGISIYIPLCFILDSIMFYNFFSRYLSIVIIDMLFIGFLICKKQISKELISDLIILIKRKLSENKRSTIILLIVFIGVLFIQFQMQISITTEELSLFSKDPFYWFKRTSQLLNKGYLVREEISIFYPEGHSYFSASCLLIFNNFEMTYFFYKFAGIPFLSFFLLTIAIIIKKVFTRNYLIIFGLIMALTSNLLITRFSYFLSSAIPVLLILISIIILYSNCPFYLIGFFVATSFFFNPLYGLYHMMLVFFFFLINVFSLKQYNLKQSLKEVLKVIAIFLLLFQFYLIYLFITTDTNLIDLLFEFQKIFESLILRTNTGSSKISLNLSSSIFLGMLNLSGSIFFEILKQIDVIFSFIQVELISFFIIFAFLTLFIPIKKIKDLNKKKILMVGNALTLILLIVFILPVLLHIPLKYNYIWMRDRSLEAFGGPLIIIICIPISMIVDRSKLVTDYISLHVKTYRKIVKTKISRDFLKVESLIIAFLLISSFNTFLKHKRILYKYNFSQDQIEMMFYIQENISIDSKILASDLEGLRVIYFLIAEYEYFPWNFEINSYNATKTYLNEVTIDYVLIDLTRINSTELNNFTNDIHFDNLFENDINILFKYSN